MSFLNTPRKEAGYRPVVERIADYGEVEQTLNPEDRKQQAGRCMDCGVPFCHWACPLGNRQPEWQAALSKGKWAEAYRILTSTNDFPEFTGRICPALCEKSCVLAMSHEAVTCRENEAAVAERAFNEGLVVPHPPKIRYDKKVAVIGGGPAGLAVANRLNQIGINVTLFEKDEALGGLLRFGIPDFKMQKHIIERRVSILAAEGIHFELNSKADASELAKEYDAVCVCTGCDTPRDLNVEGRELKGIHFALELLQQQNRIVAGIEPATQERISAKGKHVLVIGGGDTGSDCVGTSIRHKAASVTQIEIMPKLPEGENAATPWPLYPQVLKTSTSHEEGCIRRWSLDTLCFNGENGVVKSVVVEEVEWKDGKPIRTGRKDEIKADLVLLAMGFIHKSKDEVARNVFVAGDAAAGASLVVRAIASGRKVAQEIEAFLIKE